MVKGRFTTRLGKFQAGWKNSSMLLQGRWQTPVRTRGTVTVPVVGGKRVAKLVVNGTELDLGVATTSGQVQHGTSAFGEGLVTLAVVGGNGSIEVSYA